MNFFRKVKVILFGATLLLLAEGSFVHAKEGLYLGAQIPYSMVDGDFDNSTMPMVDAGFGIGLIAGYGITPRFSVEINWSESRHKSAGATIGFRELSLNGKYNLQVSDTIQPFLFAGIGTFTLGDNSLMFGGIGYNLGLGVDSYINQNLSWGAGLFRKIITYDEIVKSEGPAELIGELNGDTTSIRLDLTYHF